MNDIKTPEPKHPTFWWKNKLDMPKRYCVLFNTWANIRLSWSCTCYDTLEEALDEAKLINIYYSTTPKPERIRVDYESQEYDEYRNYSKWKFDFSDGKCWWGYAILDMANEKFIKVVNQFNGSPLVGKKGFTILSKPTLENYDVYFRKENEVPLLYTWKGPRDEEYEGWLQFRWGDGKNAIGYVEPVKKERPGHDEYVNIYDEATDTYVRTKVRVVDVGWDEPLPKKEKGIYYRRPNKEPVIFPGEFGYEKDYSIWPWSLAEENNDYHYEDKKSDNNTLASLLDNETIKKLINTK